VLLLFAQCKMNYWWLVTWLDLTFFAFTYSRQKKIKGRKAEGQPLIRRNPAWREGRLLQLLDVKATGRTGPPAFLLFFSLSLSLSFSLPLPLSLSLILEIRFTRLMWSYEDEEYLFNSMRVEFCIRAQPRYLFGGDPTSSISFPVLDPFDPQIARHRLRSAKISWNPTISLERVCVYKSKKGCENECKKTEGPPASIPIRFLKSSRFIRY
jgi:hypothetical protein